MPEVAMQAAGPAATPAAPSDAIRVIIPNLHWRYSGVTATNRMVGPFIAKRVSTVWLGSHRPDGLAPLSWGELLRLRFQGRRHVWHARRNNEMIVGVLLRWLGWPLDLVFTSAAQRRHSWITRFLINRMAAVIATTEQAASYLARRATVIHHGVDCQTFSPPPDRSSAFAEAGLPGKFAIGCFGRVRPQKGTDLFVEAMCRLLPRYPDFTAVIVGAITPEHQVFADELREKAARAGLAERIRFLGEQPIADVPRWFQRLTVFAFTSRNEGFGLTLIEGMAAGNALVAARAGAAENVVVSPAIGTLFAAGNADALTAALEPLLASPEAAAEMGRRAREYVLEAHDVEKEAAHIVEVYHAAAAAPRSP